MHDETYPHVTDIIKIVLPQYQNGTEWHMQRGRAAHACYAMLAQGKQFEYDEQISGYVEGWRKWQTDVNPVFREVEIHAVHPTYHFQGTADAVAMIGNTECIIDYKASHDPRTELQLGFYALLLHKLKQGWQVVINEIGKYKMHGPYDLKRARNEALAILTVYNVMQRLGLANNSLTVSLDAKRKANTCGGTGSP